MLETVRVYALEHLAASGEEEAVREAHAAHYLALAEQAEAALNGPDQAPWYEGLEREHDNLRAVLAWTQEGPAPDIAVGRARRALGLRLAGALWQFWHAHGHLSEGRAWLARCLEGAAVADETPARAKALNGAGWMAAMQGDYPQATALLTASVSFYRALDDAAGQSFALANLAGVSYRHADYDRAAELYEEALAMARACGDRPNMINALNSLALIAREQGDYARAAELYGQCLTVSRELGHLEYVALSSLGRLAREQGDVRRARALLEEALGLAQQAGDTTHAAGVLFNLAVVVRQQGDNERAAALLQESAGLHRAMGHQDGLGVTLLHLGLISAACGAPEKAVRQCTQALRLCASAGETPRVAECFEGLAEAWRAHGSGERAARLCGVAEALRTRIGASLPHGDRAGYESMVERLRAALGDGAFSAVWQAGQTMSLQQALAEAYTAAATLDVGDPPDHHGGRTDGRWRAGDFSI
jgi:tetratricopeptide (TPR) repeat protein